MMNRRTMLATCAGALPALSSAAADGPKTSVGLVIHSFPVRAAGERDLDRRAKISDPVRFLDHCKGLGVAAIQVDIGARDDAYADALRARAEAASMAIEGIIALPKDDADVARFEAEVRTAKRVGATIVRTVMLSGRRYENYDALDAFQKAAGRASHGLSLAAPIVVRHGIQLAVENHKDWRADDLIRILKRLGCDHVGVCLDTGNSISLLEDPMEVVEALAPLAITTHLKDMAVEEYADGFLLSEVPFGAGMIDLTRVVKILRAARPEIRLIIEMITRDPLKVPCLTDKYWATFPTLPAKVLARSLTMVRKHTSATPLPRVSTLSQADRLRVEDDNLNRCIKYARERLIA